MTKPIDARALLKSGALLEEIAEVFGVERHDGELLRSWCRRIDMAIYSEELIYKSLRTDVDVQLEYRRDAERAGSASKLEVAGTVVPGEAAVSCPGAIWCVPGCRG